MYVNISSNKTPPPHVALWLLPGLNNLFIVICMGVGYAAVAGSLWPLLAYNVDKKISSTCYGLMQSLQLFGLFVAFKVSGFIMDMGINADEAASDDYNVKKKVENLKRGNYYYLSMFFVICI